MPNQPRAGVQCQFGKGKAWEGFVPSVADHTLELRVDGRVEHTADIFGCSVSETSGKRKGHPYCLRIDLRRWVGAVGRSGNCAE